MITVHYKYTNATSTDYKTRFVTADKQVHNALGLKLDLQDDSPE